MKLPRFLRRHVELGSQFIEEVYPISVPALSLFFAEPHDYQVLLGGYVDVLPILAARREVRSLVVRGVYPPEVLVL
jgi:hypothetical protein